MEKSMTNTTISDPTGIASSEKEQNFFGKLYQRWVSLVKIEPATDDFSQILRKSAAGIILGTVPVPIFFASYLGYLGFRTNAAEDSHDGSVVGMRIGMVVYLLCIPTLLFPFVFLRIKGTLSASTMDIQVFLIWMQLVMMELTTPQINCNSLFVSLTLYALLAQSKHCALQFGMSACMLFYSNYNSAFLIDKDTATLLLLPGFRFGPAIEAFVAQACVSFVAILLLSGVFLQSAEHVNSVARAHAAVSLSQRIVDLLRRYDTEGVRCALDDGASGVDPQLVASLHAMNANLETYKPFLPNYLFQSGDTGGEEDDDEGSLELSRVSSSSGQRTLSNSQNKPRGSTAASEADDTASGSSHGGSTPGTPSRLVSLGGVAGSAFSVFDGKITFALVECPTFCGASGARRATAFVEALHGAAEETKASLHTMVGDAVQLTWNATHRVLQPEVKAARCLAKLHRLGTMALGASLPLGETAAASASAPTFCGAAFTGRASCVSVTTTRKQNGFLVSAAWMPALHQAFALAREHGAMLIDEMTDAVSSLTFLTLAVDLVCWGGGGGGSSGALPRKAGAARGGASLVVDGAAQRGSASDGSRRVVFDLVEEMVFDQDNEWLYTVGRKDARSTALGQLSAASRSLLAATVGDGGDDTSIGAAATGVLGAIAAVEEHCAQLQAASPAASEVAMLHERALVTRLERFAHSAAKAAK